MTPYPIDDYENHYRPHCSYRYWNSLSNSFSESEFAMISVNMRSMKNKFSEFKAHLASCKIRFAIIILTETWVTEIEDYTFDLDGYNCISLYRPNGVRGGGIKIYHFDSLLVNRIDDLTSVDGDCERIFVDVLVPNVGSMIVGAIYRPPQLDVRDFNQSFCRILESIKHKSCIIAGDININIMNSNTDPLVQDYIDSYTQHAFTNEISLPTYHSPITGSDISCLDHILTNLSLDKTSLVIKPNLSDHFATALILSKEIPSPPKVIKFRSFDSGRIENFKENITDEFSRFSPPSDEPNAHAVYLVKFLNKVLNKFFPIMTKTLSNKRLKSPWITSDIVKCIRKKHRWYRMMRAGQINRSCYADLTRKLRQILQMAEEDYYFIRFKSLNHDMKRNWRVLNELLGRTQIRNPDNFVINNENTSDPKIISSEFCKYFISHPRSIHNSVPVSNTDYSYLIPQSNNVSNFNPCTEQEIRHILVNMKKEGGLDDIPRKFMRLCQFQVSHRLSNLFNKCLACGIFPDCLKSAKIKPVHKKGPKNLIKNYRPISILSNISKIFEAVIYTRLNQHFLSENLLSHKQFGYRKDRNTEMAILDLLSKILPAIEKKKFAIIVFLDYSACFDSISREILLKKLDAYGITGNDLRLIGSYLANRVQSVIFGNSESEKLTQDIGVIQGSRLGPLLYDIYSNDFNYLCSEDENIQYADDTCLVYIGDDLNELVQQVNRRLNMVNDWCNANKLFLNRTKSEFMLVTTRHVHTDPEIFIGEDKLSRVGVFRYLGVNIDSSLKYHTQLNLIKAKFSQHCGASYRLRNRLDLTAAKNLYYSCFYSVATYCICVYGGVMLCTQRAASIIKLQSKIMKNLFKKFLPESTNLFKDMKILKLPDIYRLRAAVYMFRVVVLDECPTVRRNLSLDYPDHQYSTRTSNDLILPFPRVEALRMNFQYQFVDVWNSIPDHIKEAVNLKTFKRMLLNHFLDNY